MKFGKTARRLREEQNVSITQFAKRVGISPTYLAPIERDVFSPPAELKVVRIAKALGQDPDEFLALAGRIGTDLRRIIYRRPSQAARVLYAIEGFADDEVEHCLKTATKKTRRRARRPRVSS